MRLIFLTLLTMTAFAANSILNRMAVDSSAIDPASFAMLRVASGAVMLSGLTLARRKTLPLRVPGRLKGAVSLVTYMVGFSAAYLTLDAGLGALVLFGVVQISIFGLAAVRGAPPSARQVLGAGIAFAGLAWVLWPAGAVRVDPVGVLCMVLAGAGWAYYTLAGRSEPDALAGTAANFCVAVPLVALAYAVFPAEPVLTGDGVMLAVLSGAVTSGLGYALWYAVVPRFSPSMAAIVQLLVPVIAMAAGVILLGEYASVRLILGAVLVLGGIALAVRRPARTAGVN
ncbi:DMT family transporter [Sedimentitalea sp. JM2-8]|uniref:DMT family transporter n=1 Tax=Sedimentitalea xiamensis TaxID=3050037 RepID=A0ABT7FED6_9RHOB|nr:DMT family transporter [Sedimentitalea xiamensis]MDK3073184.1 DMT family transporter [Sedimentitalea xiamensis]